MTKCPHKRLKKNYPFGRKSAPVIYCKDCGGVITKLELKKMKKNKRYKGGKRR